MTLCERLADPFAWLAAITASTVAWIAYQQHETARAKLRLDLFDRRMKVYEAVIALLRHVFQNADAKLEEIYRFTQDTSNAPFLFGPEIETYLELLRKNAVRVRTLRSRLSESGLGVGEERNKVVEEDSKLLIWFGDQFDVAQKTFTPYLDFKNQV